METLTQVSDWITRMLDIPLGWLLVLPRDLAILLVAVGTSLVLTLARKWTTDQDRLRRAKHDLRRLKQLRREARRARDKEAVQRIRGTVGMIQILRMKSEGLPLLVSLLPIALLAIWALARLDYFAPQKGEALRVEANYPVSSVGKLTHMLPSDKFEVDQPIRFIRKDPAGQVGVAQWTIRPTAEFPSENLVIVHGGERVRHPFSVGGHTYLAPIRQHDGKIQATQVLLRQAKFLGIVPGIPEIFFPPWLVAYLLIAVVCVPIIRRGLGVC